MYGFGTKVPLMVRGLARYKLAWGLFQRSDEVFAPILGYLF